MTRYHNHWRKLHMNILGPEPPKVPDLVKRKMKAMTFEQLREEDISLNMIDLRL